MHCVYYPPEVGGLESHVHQLCRALVERGHRVGIVTSLSMPDVPGEETVDGVRVWRVPLREKTPVGWFAHAVRSIPRSIAEAGGVDLLHAHAFQSFPPLWAARLARRRPLVMTWHTSHFLRLAKRPAWGRLLGRFVRSADHNFATSRQLAEVAEGLAPGIRVEAVVNGVETSVFRPVAPTLSPPPAGRIRVVVPRRLHVKNGVEYLIRALPRVCERVDVEAVIVGDGPERAALEGLVRESSLEDRVRFLGAQRHDEMPGILCSASASVVPSLMEATSVAALESMACGLPVAASRVGGLPEIVDESVGALFEPADVEDLARGLTELLLRPDLDAAGQRARARVADRWSNARLVDRHVEVYEELIADRRVRRTA